MYKKKNWFIVVALVLVLVFVGCGKKESNKKNENDKLNIVTTFYPVYDFTTNIVADKADVEMLIDGTVEPHDFEPSAKDIAKIQEADVFIYSSKEMETWVSSALSSIDTKKVKVIDASKGIEFLKGSEEEEHEGEEAGHDHGGVDPHVWLDPILAKQETKTILNAIVSVDPENQDTYKKNAQDFTARLEKLDQAYQTAFEKATNKTFVTQHMAFGYLAHRYGLEQKAISGISPEQEPTPNELASMEDYVKENNVAVIFTEELSSSKISKTISEATGAELAVLNTLEGVSKEDKQNGNGYIEIMERNLESLKKAIK